MSDYSRVVSWPSTGGLRSLENRHRGNHTWGRRVSVSCGPEQFRRLSRQWQHWRASVGSSSCESLKRCPSRQRGWRVIPWSCLSLPKLVATRKCDGRFMSGDGRGSDSSDATPRPAASLKVNRWLGEGLRQWRGSSQTSSVIPHIVATDGIPCGGGALRPPSTAPQMWLTSSGGGGGRGWPQRWSTLWATLTLRWLGLWCFHGLLVARVLMSVWLCCWPPCGVTPCMQALSGSPRRRRWRCAQLLRRHLAGVQRRRVRPRARSSLIWGLRRRTLKRGAEDLHAASQNTINFQQICTQTVEVIPCS